MDAPTWISVITGIVSIVLAIGSLVVSFVFYKWSAQFNKDMTAISQSITERTDYLGKLFDKMFDTTFSLVKADSEAMRHHLFKSGDVGVVSEKEGDKTIDVVSYIRTGCKTKEEIMRHFSMSETTTLSILEKLDKHQLIFENNGSYHYRELLTNLADSNSQS